MSERVPFDILYDLGLLESEPANNARHWTYGKGDHCDHVVDLPINESRLWCPLCSIEGGMSQLKKIFHVPTVQQVWQEHWSMATGRVESDRKRMEQYGKAHADQISEELGIAHAFERTDYSELRAEAMGRLPTEKTDAMEGALVSTHDRAVAEGRRESKGRFVH